MTAHNPPQIPVKGSDAVQSTDRLTPNLSAASLMGPPERQCDGTVSGVSASAS